jgi:hypothetical protein
MLEFYFSHELREKESFFFVLFQLKEYHNLEQLAKPCTFDSKLLREVRDKLEELEKSKASWILRERLQYGGIACKLQDT